MKIVRMLVVTVIGIGVVFGILAQGQRDWVALSVDNTVPKLDVQKLQKGIRCTNRGTHRECVPGEILAILNSSTLEEGPDDAIRNNVRSALDQLFNPISNHKVHFTNLEVQRLAAPQENLASPELTTALADAQACGHTLLKFSFDPKVDVQLAIKELQAALEPGSIQATDLYAVQPSALPLFGQIPNTSEPQNTKSPAWATEAIKRTKISENIVLPNVRVAVLDSGFGQNSTINDINLESSLAGDFTKFNATIYGAGTFNDDFVNGTGVNVGHGTGIVSIIGHRNPDIGVAPNASIVPIKVCDKKGYCNEAGIIAGICYATSLNPRASVINLSLATLTDPKILSLAIQDATRFGSLVVTAAGNTRNAEFVSRNKSLKNTRAFPAGIIGGSQLSVGAVFTNNDYATFATTKQVDLVAPGSWIQMLSANGSLLTNAEGTSFSAAYASGAAALVIGKSVSSGANLTAPMLKNFLMDTANPALCNPTNSGNCGKGMLDVQKAWSKSMP